MTYSETAGHYPVRFVEELQGGASTWFAEHPNLPGCHATGDTMAEVQEKLLQNREAWLKWAESQGVPIPEPKDDPMVTIQYALRASVAKTTTAGESSSENVAVKV